MNKIITTLWALLLIQFLVVNKSYSSDGEVKDCFEKLNRVTFALNMGLDKVIFKPIAKGYRKLPDPIQKGTTNAVKNLSNLITIPNNVLQGDIKTTISRNKHSKQHRRNLLLTLCPSTMYSVLSTVFSC